MFITSYFKHMKKLLLKNNKGFSILAVILVIVGVIVAIGVWSLSGQSNTNTSSSSSDIQAATIINDSISLKTGYDNLIINGANPDNITFIPNTPSTSSSPNILDPGMGVPLPKIPTSSLRGNSSLPTPEGFWILHKGLNLKNLTPEVVGEHSFVVAGIKDEVCKRINYSLYGIAQVDYVNLTGTMIIKGITGPAVEPDNPVSTWSVTPNPVFATGNSGCIGHISNPDRNLYFLIAKYY